MRRYLGLSVTATKCVSLTVSAYFRLIKMIYFRFITQGLMALVL